MRAGITAIAAMRCDRATDAIPHCPTETEFASMIFQATAGTKKIVEQRKPGFMARLETVLSVVVLAGGLSTRTRNNFTTGGIAWQYRWGGGL
jgi:hypothetical protein